MQHLNGPAPDIVIVDQLPYHIVWPRGGNASALAETMKRAFPAAGTEHILVFIKYNDLSAKYHERVRFGGKGPTDNQQSIT